MSEGAIPIQSPTRIIEFVFRYKTNAYQDQLDDFMEVGAASEFGPENEPGDDELFMSYIPEGSHWRDTTVDPSATTLPGGNRLGELTRFGFYEPVEEEPDTDIGWGTSTRTVRLVCYGWGADPDLAWEEAVRAGRAEGDPPDMVIIDPK